MKSDEWARRLMAEERKEWQNPGSILGEVGLKKGDVVADLGCGPGFFTVHIAKMVGPTGKVYAVDFDERMLRHLERNVLRHNLKGAAPVKTVHRHVIDTGIPAGSVDVAFFADVLHDIEYKPQFLGEVKRITKPHGLAVDVDWSDEKTEFGPPAYMRLSKKDAVSLFKNNGFAFVREVDGGLMHYGLVFKRADDTLS